MIICVNDRATISENAFVSIYDNFIIEFDDGHKFLYKKVSFNADSNNFTYMRIRERLGDTLLDFGIIRKDETTFKDIINAGYNEEDTYNIYKVSKIQFPNLDVTYAYW